MAILNHNYLVLKSNYLFREIADRRDKFLANNPNAELIKMDIGDVTLPLPRVIGNAMSKASIEMTNPKYFRGYDDGGLLLLFFSYSKTILFNLST